MAMGSMKDVSALRFRLSCPNFFAGHPVHIVNDDELRSALRTPLADSGVVGAAIGKYVDQKTRGLWHVHPHFYAEIALEVGRMLARGDSPDDIIALIDDEIVR